MGVIRPLVYLYIGFCTLLEGSVFAQSEAKVLLANFKQDLELVSRELNSLRSEVEMLRRENAQLRVAIKQDQRSKDQTPPSGIVFELQNRTQALELAFRQSERDRGKSQEEISKKFQQVIEQMNQGFEQVTKASSSEPKVPSFSNEYPKNGFVHIIEKGETISSIAVKYKSKVSWIINANQISDPTKVFVGRELFVPQK